MTYALITFALVVFSASNLPPVFIECDSTSHDLTMRFIFDNYEKLYPPKCFLSNMKYHYYRVTKGLEPLSPKWESIEYLENKIKELEK
jgi:hypothetical protein